MEHELRRHVPQSEVVPLLVVAPPAPPPLLEELCEWFSALHMVEC